MQRQAEMCREIVYIVSTFRLYLKFIRLCVNRMWNSNAFQVPWAAEKITFRQKFIGAKQIHHRFTFNIRFSYDPFKRETLVVWFKHKKEIKKHNLRCAYLNTMQNYICWGE